MNQPLKTKVIAIFEGSQIRRHWDADKELWYFSVIDVVRVLTDSTDARKYWNKLAQRLREEGSELSEKIGQLKLIASDGKNSGQSIKYHFVNSISKVEVIKFWSMS